jgi:hypothetical protein
MASVQEIRQRLRGQRIEGLRSRIEPLLTGRAGAEVWLFGSLARGDWDARSDVDLLAVAPDQSAADQLADALLGTGLADDVIALSQGRWLERQRGDDPGGGASAAMRSSCSRCSGHDGPAADHAAVRPARWCRQRSRPTLALERIDIVGIKSVWP